MADSEPLVVLREIRRDYQRGVEVVAALRGVNLSIQSGEMVAVMGPSGSGKSTLMNLLGCLDRPTTGTYHLLGRDVSRMSRDELAGLRLGTIGFIFQGFNLLARTSALENVELPLLYAGIKGSERQERAMETLRLVGLAGREHHTPAQLSGGQQQRVAIARALVNRPHLLLADEPTGNLDSRTALEVMELLQRLNQERGLTILVVTHEQDIATYAGRWVVVRDGRIRTDEQHQPRAAREDLMALQKNKGPDDEAAPCG